MLLANVGLRTVGPFIATVTILGLWVVSHHAFTAGRAVSSCGERLRPIWTDAGGVGVMLERLGSSHVNQFLDIESPPLHIKAILFLKPMSITR